MRNITRQILAAAMLLTASCSIFAQKKHVFFVWSDIQVYEDKELDYVREAAADIKATADSIGLPAFTVHCGDLLGEYYQQSPTFPVLKEAMESTGLKTYNVIGNHDLFHNAGSPEQKKEEYLKHFGQTRQSFRMGKTYYFLLDDFSATEGWEIKPEIGKENMEWLRGELRRLKVRKGAPVVIFAHVPTAQLLDKEEFYAMLEPYNVQLMTGHTHWQEFHQISDNMEEHVHAPLSGLFWQSLMSCDGIPWGYYVYEVDGKDITWYYKAVGRSRDEQFTAYAVGEDPRMPDSVVLNIWNYDPEWQVLWREDGGEFRPMTRFDGYDAAIVADVEERRDTEFKWKYIGAGKTGHLFQARPSRKNAEVEVKVTDRFGREYLKKIQ